MALGGGTFITQNKVLPGGYINFVSKSTGVNVFGNRGVGAIAKYAHWGDSSVQVITKEDLQKNSLAIFGYEYTSEELMWARDFFKHSKTMLYYRLNDSGGAIAKNTYAQAKYQGALGNSLKIVIQKNVDDETKFDVITYLGTTVVDSQTVTSASELADNDFVRFIKSATLQETAGTALTGGANGNTTGSSVQSWLSEMESYSFNAITLLNSGEEYQELLIEWTKRMRNEIGKKFQAVTCVDTLGSDIHPNDEGIVVQFNTFDSDSDYSTAWLCGAVAGCEINESLTNMKYDGEDEIYPLNLTQLELEEYTNKGYLCFHKVNDEVRVLLDINSLTEFTEEKGKVFSNNQTVRVCDQIAMDIATIFNNYYLGKVPNDASGRISLWNEIVKHHKQLNDIRAIEDFESDDVVVTQGNDKTSVVVEENITVVNTMEKLYMTVYVG